MVVSQITLRLFVLCPYNVASFEEILEGVDDKGNQLTFAGQLRLLPVPK